MQKICTKPDCDCIAQAEAKAGGPVKSCPCLAPNLELKQQVKQTFVHAEIKQRKYPELLNKINDAIIGLQLSIINNLRTTPDGEDILKRYPIPAKEQLIDLLGKCRNAIIEIKEDPLKY